MVRGQDGESGGVAWCGLALLACVYPSAQSAHPSCESLSTSGTSYVEFSAATSRNVDGGRRRVGGGVGRNTELEERQETNVVARQRPIQGQRGDGVSEEGAWCGLARRVHIYLPVGGRTIPQVPRSVSKALAWRGRRHRGAQRGTASRGKGGWAG
jgi:hypothetical protein